MNKMGFIVAALLFVSGCDSRVEVSGNLSSTPQSDDAKHYDVVCLDGVEYWNRGWSLAPKIDKNRLVPVRCKS